MSDRYIARARAAKAAAAADITKEADEVEAMATFFNRTGGKDCWSNKWGWWNKSRKLDEYSGVRVDANGKVAEVMLSFNGLNSTPDANQTDGNDWGTGLNGLRFLQSLNIHGQ